MGGINVGIEGLFMSALLIEEPDEPMDPSTTTTPDPPSGVLVRSLVFRRAVVLFAHIFGGEVLG